MVAFGMVGASISGVTFVSVPGMVLHSDMTYMQTCLGFILGYVAVAFILLPVYYRMNLTTIYTYLYNRLGERSYKTGAWFFLLSKMTGAAARFYVVCIILQRFVLDALGVPFALTVVCMVALIWLYTRRGGIKTLVWTDTLQTTCMFTALLLIIWQVTKALGMSPSEAVTAIMTDSHSRVFVFDDWVSRQNFWKQFLSGIFIVIVMTGLDQDMMQKNLTCKSLREAQKDMCSYGVAFVPANLLFLTLGILLTMVLGTGLRGDELLLAGVEVLVAHLEPLPPVQPLGIHTDSVLTAPGQRHEGGRVGDADMDVAAGDKRRSLSSVVQRHRTAHDMTQQQQLGGTFPLPTSRQVQNCVTWHTRLPAQCQQLRRILFETPQRHTDASDINNINHLLEVRS